MDERSSDKMKMRVATYFLASISVINFDLLQILTRVFARFINHKGSRIAEFVMNNNYKAVIMRNE